LCTIPGQTFWTRKYYVYLIKIRFSDASPGCEEQQEHQQQPLQVEDGVAVAALQHHGQPKPS
jgi:hypothetical protein